MKFPLRRWLIGFFVMMAFLTWFSWKIDELRTPYVLCTQPGQGSVCGQHYDYVVPNSCLYEADGSTYVYSVEATASWFYPVIARRIKVKVLCRSETNSALSGVYGGLSLVRYATRPLADETMPVRLWEEEVS